LMKHMNVHTWDKSFSDKYVETYHGWVTITITWLHLLCKNGLFWLDEKWAGCRNNRCSVITFYSNAMYSGWINGCTHWRQWIQHDAATWLADVV